MTNKFLVLLISTVAVTGFIWASIFIYGLLKAIS